MPSAKSSVICIASINNQNDYRKPLFNEFDEQTRGLSLTVGRLPELVY
jgi:hypothetical protein